MTFQKRKFLQFVAASGVALTLAACGGGGDSGGTDPGTGTGGSGGSGGGGGTGALTLTGSSNIPGANVLTPGAGAPGTSTAALASKLLIAEVSDLNNGVLRTLMLTINPLGTGATPAVGVVYAIQDPDSNGNYANANLVLPVLSAQVTTAGGKVYVFGDVKSSGTVKVTAMSATSIDLLLTNVTLSQSTDPKSSATGNAVLNGTVTLPLTGK